jgi:hypothetical protein
MRNEIPICGNEGVGDYLLEANGWIFTAQLLDSSMPVQTNVNVAQNLSSRIRLEFS